MHFVRFAGAVPGLDGGVLIRRVECEVSGPAVRVRRNNERKTRYSRDRLLDLELFAFRVRHLAADDIHPHGD